jgi:hypothetical protein
MISGVEAAVIDSSVLLAVMVGTATAGVDATPGILTAQDARSAEPPSKQLDPTLRFSLLQDAVEEEAGPPDEYERVTRYGEKGSQRWNIRGGIGVAFGTSEDTLGLLGVGYSYFIADSVSLDLELQGMVFSEKIQDTEGINLNLIARWHLINRRDWSIFLDGGAGILVTTDDVPANGSSFNFTPQVGGGFTFSLGGGTRLMAGARWHHISNANLYETNPGRDSLMGYLGVSFPF